MKTFKVILVILLIATLFFILSQIFNVFKTEKNVKEISNKNYKTVSIKKIADNPDFKIIKKTSKDQFIILESENQ